MKRVACVGSREIQAPLSQLLMDIGRYLARQGYTISSGNAHGADHLYAQGANQVDPQQVELHLPWASYNPENIHEDNLVSIDGDKPEYQEIASRLHPEWRRLGRGPRALHARNVAIVQGCCLVIAVPNWSKPGGGGTGMALRLAKHFNIPVLDLTKPEDLERVQRRLG